MGHECRHVVTLLLLSLSVSGCAARSPSAEQSRLREEQAKQAAFESGRQALFAAYPSLVGKEVCVGRVAVLRNPPTWDELGRASMEICVPPSNWVPVTADTAGRPRYVDSSRLEIREHDQVSFWFMAEIMDKDQDYTVSRLVVDCDQKRMAPLASHGLTAGQASNFQNYDGGGLNWSSLPPGSMGEAALAAVCGYRDEAIAGSRPPGSTPKKTSSRAKREAQSPSKTGATSPAPPPPPDVPLPGALGI